MADFMPPTTTPGAAGDRRPAGTRCGGSSLTHLAMGIFLTMFGVLLTLDTLNLVNLSSVLRWWPIGFHVFGLTVLASRSDRHARFWAIASLVLGTLLLLNTLDVADVGLWELVWPLIILTIGVRLVMRARRGDSLQAGETMALGHRPNLVAVLSESKGSVMQTLAGASLTSVLGGCHLDLRQATVAPGTTPVVDVFAVFGGQEITVPHGWVVVFDVVSILAGTEDKRLPAIAGQAAATPAPQIIVRGITIFSSLTLKN